MHFQKNYSRLYARTVTTKKPLYNDLGCKGCSVISVCIGWKQVDSSNASTCKWWVKNWGLYSVMLSSKVHLTVCNQPTKWYEASPMRFHNSYQNIIRIDFHIYSSMIYLSFFYDWLITSPHSFIVSWDVILLEHLRHWTK